jgi:hypothetical protein
VFRALLIGSSLAASLSAHGDQLASYKSRGGQEIALMTEPCGAKGGKSQRAHKRSKGSETDGCWAVNRRGNPVVRWGDGRVQELKASRVRLAPKYAAMLEDADAPGEAQAETAPAPAFARATWCKDAKLPHERLICRDPELAATDLALAPLWQSYRTELKLNAVQQGRVKSDYFRRLKACGAQKDCIVREQAAQTRFYRDALARQ